MYFNELNMPDGYKSDIQTLLDNTNPNKIYLSSDWHFFKNHYKKEANYVNTQKILTWCRQNIKNDDIFMYLGDISFRYANDEDKKEAQKLMSSIPGTKILILGNHDIMAGEEFYTGCGFDYIFERLDWHNITFTHKPINVNAMPNNHINIHGHIHNIKEYNTTDGKYNINVYPYFYGNKPVTLSYCLSHIDKLTKDNLRSNWTNIGEASIEDIIKLETKRSNLPDSSFGIPEDRKFPLDSKKHVKSAIKLFGHAEESKKKSLAKRIKTAADKYNITISKNTEIDKYLSKLINEDGANNSDAIFKNDSLKETIPVIINDGLKYVDASKIKLWYASYDRDISNLSSYDYSNNMIDAIENSINEKSNDIVRYIFISDGGNPICIGMIYKNKDKAQWLIQYPIKYEDGKFIDQYKEKIYEWAMAACNPIVGITKPYILKTYNDSGSIIDAKAYALAPDLISDKYLVVNENAKLSIVDSSYFDNMLIEEYEFVGDKRNLKKIYEAYHNGKIVDNTFFYTSLTGKPLLTEDQIDYDDNFKKVDFMAMKEASLTKLATLNNNIMENMNMRNVCINAIPNNYVTNLIKNKNYLILKKDIDGYYIYNEDTKSRTASIEDQNFITEQMVASVL